MPEMTKAACECEYPCSCVSWRGKTFTSPGDLVDYLSGQVDVLSKVPTQPGPRRRMRPFTDGG